MILLFHLIYLYIARKFVVFHVISSISEFVESEEADSDELKEEEDEEEDYFEAEEVESKDEEEENVELNSKQQEVLINRLLELYAYHFIKYSIIFIINYFINYY